MRQALAAIVGTIGVLRCSQNPAERFIPVYNPPREVIGELAEGMTAYKEVWSDARTLKVSLYVELDDGTRVAESSWEREELKYTGKCVKKSLRTTADASYTGVPGKVTSLIEDPKCDGLEVTCSATFNAVDGTSQDVSGEFCSFPGLTVAELLPSLEETFSTLTYDLGEQTRLWHERKGVKE